MLPLIGGLMSGASSLLGGFMSSQTSAANTQANIQAQQNMQSQTEQFNAGQAQVARDYETQMSNTAYQRATKDMEAAGLNPMMMFGSGSAASTPSSPSPSVGTPNMALSQRTSPFNPTAVNAAINTAIDGMTYNKMIEEVANLRTAGRLGEAQIRTEAQRPELVAAEADVQQQRAKLEREAIPQAVFGAKSAEDLLSMPEAARKAGVIGGWAGGKASDVIAPFLSGAGSVLRFLPRSGTRSGENAAGDFNERWSERVGGVQ